MTPTALDLKHALLDAGLTIAAVARSIPARRSHVSLVLHGTWKTPYIRRGIAVALGKTYSELWGEADPGVDRLTPVQRTREPRRWRIGLPLGRRADLALDPAADPETPPTAVLVIRASSGRVVERYHGPWSIQALRAASRPMRKASDAALAAGAPPPLPARPTDALPGR